MMSWTDSLVGSARPLLAGTPPVTSAVHLEPPPGARAGLSLLPAAHFDALLSSLAARADEPVALDLQLPFCAVHCPYCERDVHAAASRALVQDYVDGLVAEIGLLAQALGSRRDVVQLRLGGGSANELSDSQLAAVVQALQSRWRLGADTEMSIDCDPRRTGQVQLQLMRGLGFRQISFGVVDLDPQVQAAIGRSQSAALVDDVCDLARRSGFEQVSLDLMIGLPHQTPGRWRETLQRVLAFAPDRIGLHCYRSRSARALPDPALDQADLPDDGECAELARVSARVLADAGYVALGDDRFVLDSDPLLGAGVARPRRTQIGFTTASPAAVLGLGTGATSAIEGRRFGHEGDLASWRDAVARGCLPVTRLIAESPADLAS